MRKCMEEFAHLLGSRDTCLYVQTYEEQEFIQDICQLVAGETEYKPRIDVKASSVYTYSRFEGLCKLDIKDPFNEQKKQQIKSVTNISKMFQYIQAKQNSMEQIDDVNGWGDVIRQKAGLEETSSANSKETTETDEEEEQGIKEQATIFILKDLHLFFDKDTIRTIRDLKEHWDETSYCPIIVTSPVVDLPCELEKIFTYFEYEPMSQEDIWHYVYDSLCDFDFSEELIHNFCKACLGLTAREIWRALSHSLRKYHTINLQAIQEEKVQIVKKSGALDYLTPKQTMEDTGGYENLKVWIKELKNSLDPEAKTYGVPQPKGAMLVGLPGNGKTMAAEVAANYLGVPLLQLDLAKIMGSFVGQSERQIANALRIAKACAPCIVLIDEAEKLFGGYQSSANTDSGTLNRVLAQLLNFLQDDNSGVITIMTSNNVSELPPELTRSGRLDAQWYFGFPNVQERKEIFNIYLKKNNLNVTDNMLNKLVRDTDNYSGAEIKEVVKNLVIKSYYRQKDAGVELTRDITVDDIKRSVASVIPVYVSSGEKVKQFVQFAKGRYRIASAEAI